jgi:hypothetical protein
MLVPGAFLAGLGLLSACGSGDPPRRPVVLELATWWSSMAEPSPHSLLDVQKDTGRHDQHRSLASPQILQPRC